MVLGKPYEKIMWPQKNHYFREKCILSMFQMDTHYYNTTRGTYQTWFNANQNFQSPELWTK